ncbi:phosphatidylserine decarboxylase [Nitrospirillum sp. BR 11828]|uniref:phosphatidylserine decarboxylase n=1 Tax=Nitrospirillum sp. BR 11828 TaxID=3104325 RepID=UPI002ACA3CCA|nr:phosphatidylserine decarboxylase [Nitrospirillum sp. BR 11828]MDZ5648437.1 phosphatidylserine decarboxylase [Nitrospirillum sp. BR 11828]
MGELHPVVAEMQHHIKHHHDFATALDKGIKRVKDLNVHWENTKGNYVPLKAAQEVENVQDWIVWINSLLSWVPVENMSATELFNHQNLFFFYLDQPEIVHFQTLVEPHNKAPELTWLSAWMVRYVGSLGKFLGTTASITEKSLDSFIKSPAFNMDEYISPPSGYLTFNQFFARQEKSGTRPIAAPSDNRVIVNSCDGAIQGWWQINLDNRITPNITMKGLTWSIGELLQGSKYADRFNNGIFMHSWLALTDSHRLIAPVAGRVLEAHTVMGQVYRNIVAQPIPGAAAPQHVLTLTTRQVSSVPSQEYQLVLNNTPGYQFAQERAIFVLDSPIGLVAVIPVGMGFVSSVVPTTFVGAAVQKGDEICYVQYGGSDCIVLFEASAAVNLTAATGQHYLKGQVLGYAYPILD